MERITVSVSDEFATELAAFMTDHHYDNRSEAVRDLARLGLQRARLDAGVAGPCVATLAYMFDHHKRDLARRLTDAHHDHQGLQVATLHVHIDHAACLEVAVLRGDAAVVRDFARGVIAERGVMHGRLDLLPTGPTDDAHPHPHPEH